MAPLADGALADVGVWRGQQDSRGDQLVVLLALRDGEGDVAVSGIPCRLERAL